MNETELQEYLDQMIMLSADIASKNTVTSDDKVKLKAINQAEKLISQNLNNIKMNLILEKIQDIESQMHDMDMQMFEV